MAAENLVTHGAGACELQRGDPLHHLNHRPPRTADSPARWAFSSPSCRDVPSRAQAADSADSATDTAVSAPTAASLPARAGTLM
jgi:hypothetical protein